MHFLKMGWVKYFDTFTQCYWDQILTIGEENRSGHQFSILFRFGGGVTALRAGRSLIIRVALARQGFLLMSLA